MVSTIITLVTIVSGVAICIASWRDSNSFFKLFCIKTGMIASKPPTIRKAKLITIEYFNECKIKE